MDTQHLDVLAQGVAEWNKQRRARIIVRPELEGADLSGMNLEGVDLRLANLSYANLAGSNLTVSNLTAANLLRANLTEANLVGADLAMAVLSGTSLRKARLGRAKFQESPMAGADLTDAQIGATIFADIDLRDVIGLETVVHHGPSTIGTDTLYMLGGDGHYDFLKKAGVPLSILDYLPSLTINAIDLYSCFISYSHRDKVFAESLYDALQGFGVRCWLDSHQLLPGDNIYDSVDRGIRLWDKVLLCCSEASLTSWWVDNELSLALNKERQILKERAQKVSVLIPLNLDNFIFSPSWNSGKRQLVLDRLAADFTNWEKDDGQFVRGFRSVTRILRADESAREKPPMPKI